MENEIKIQLIGDIEGYLDLQEGTDFPVTYAISDVRDLTKRQGTKSKTIKLAGSKNNNKLLNEYFDVNVIAGTFDINKLQKCSVTENGVAILDDVYIQLIKVNKLQTTNQHDQRVSYEVAIKDSTSDFFTAVGNKLLTDLEMQSDVTYHIYSSANIVASWSHDWTDVYKYVMGIGDNNVYQTQEFTPGIYALAYWEKIFESNGYQYEWDGRDDVETRFDKLIIPFNGDQSELTQDNLDDLRVVAEASAPVTYNLGHSVGGTDYYGTNTIIKLLVDTEIQDDQGYYNPATSVYTNAFQLTPSNALRYTFEINYTIVLNNDTAPAPIRITSGAGQYRLEMLPLQNGSPALNSPYGTASPNNWAYSAVTPGVYYPVGDTDIATIDSTFVMDASNLSVGSSMTVALVMRRNTFDTYQTAVDSTTDYEPGFKIRVNSVNMKIAPQVTTLMYTFPVFLNSFVPKKIKQSDFIKAFVTLYNLYIEIDPFDSKKLLIKSRDAYYDDGKAEDWTELLNKDYEQELTFLPEISKKKFLLTYKQDDKDPTLVGYTDATDEIYGQQEFEFQNEYTRDTDKKEIIFSPTIVTDQFAQGGFGFGAVTPTINGISPKTNIRLLYDGGMFPCQSWNIYDFGTTGQTGLTEYPLFSTFDHPSNPTFDINFGQCGYYSVFDLQPTNNNMYNTHWRRTLYQMDNSKMMSAFFDLDSYQINKMRLSDKIRIDNSWWNINRVVDYNPAKKGPTRVELLSIDDTLRMPPFRRWVRPTKPNPILGDLPVLGGWPVINGGIKDIINKKRPYLNIVGGMTEGVYGTGNIIGNGVKTGQVIGDNNIVTQDAFVVGNDNIINFEGNTVFTNNVVADDPDGFYTGNIKITADGIILPSRFAIIDGGLNTIFPFNKTNFIDIVDGTVDAVRNIGGDSKARPITGGLDGE